MSLLRRSNGSKEVAYGCLADGAWIHDLPLQWSLEHRSRVGSHLGIWEHKVLSAAIVIARRRGSFATHPSSKNGTHEHRIESSIKTEVPRRARPVEPVEAAPAWLPRPH